MDTGKDRTADLNVGSRFQEVVMFLIITAFLCTVLYGLYTLIGSESSASKITIVQLGTPQRIGDGTLDLKQLLADKEESIKNRVVYSLATKMKDGSIHFIEVRSIDLRFIDTPGLKLEAEVKGPIDIDIFEYIDRYMGGRSKYNWGRPNETVTVRLCCPVDSVEYYLKKGYGAK